MRSEMLLHVTILRARGYPVLYTLTYYAHSQYIRSTLHHRMQYNENLQNYMHIFVLEHKLWSKSLHVVYIP